MSFVTTTDIPIPTRGQSTGRPPKYPFATMQIGESFIISKKYTAKLHSKYTAACSGAKKRLNKTFSCRRTGDNQIRCWRTK